MKSRTRCRRLPRGEYRIDSRPGVPREERKRVRVRGGLAPHRGNIYLLLRLILVVELFSGAAQRRIGSLEVENDSQWIDSGRRRSYLDGRWVLGERLRNPVFFVVMPLVVRA